MKLEYKKRIYWLLRFILIVCVVNVLTGMYEVFTSNYNVIANQIIWRGARYNWDGNIYRNIDELENLSELPKDCDIRDIWEVASYYSKDDAECESRLRELEKIYNDQGEKQVIENILEHDLGDDKKTRMEYLIVAGILTKDLDKGTELLNTALDYCFDRDLGVLGYKRYIDIGDKLYRKNEKVEELEKLDLKLEDMEDRENFDFGDMKTFFCEEEDIRNIFQNEELENNINFLSKNNQLELGDLKNIKLKDVLVVVVLIGIYVFLNGMIPLGKQVEKNNNLKKQVKSLESEYLKEKNKKLPDYSEELSKLNEIDNGIKRKEYYSFIKFLVDNSVNGIDYTKVKYENKKWLIQGEIENFDNFEKFESSVRKKYENSELGYIKDNDETTVFEYTVSEKE